MATNRIIFPQGIEFKDWASAQSFVRPDLQWPDPLPVSQWWYWADCVHYASSPQYRIPYPSKSLFPTEADWQVWAAQTVYSLI